MVVTTDTSIPKFCLNLTTDSTLTHQFKRLVKTSDWSRSTTRRKREFGRNSYV